ncbi:MAG: diaminopimelate decarboxylase [Verrucomicrobia bacterium]|nr:MAG: diaminopimelate decarboxylase [Verrucomicrobiota bacterium]
MHSFHYRDGKLFCEDVDVTIAAEQFGTPLYLYSASTILDHYRRLDQALAGLDHLICYAVKANSNRAILRLLRDAGAGFDIVSGGELFRALNAGAVPAKCTFAGVGKSREEIEYALEQAVYSFNVESEAELYYINEIASAKKQRAPIALRVNPDVKAQTHEYTSTGKSENKFGVALERAAEVYERAREMPDITIRGVQMHIGSQITAAAPFVAAIDKIGPLVSELKSKYAIDFFSIGGGLGIAYESSIASGSGDWWTSRRSHPLTIRDYIDAILPSLTRLGLRILLEPGRLLVGNAGILLTRISYIKESTRKKFAIVDAGMNDLIRPALYGSYHEIVPANMAGGDSPNRPGINTSKIDIVGPVCESGDFFAQDREMPELRTGDLLAVMSAGAYGFVMASNYNSRPLPAEALVRGDKVALIRKRQSVEDLSRGEIDPTW